MHTVISFVCTLSQDSAFAAAEGTVIWKENGRNSKLLLVDFSGHFLYNLLIKAKEEHAMSLGNSLFNARKKRGLSQEEVAGKDLLDISEHAGAPGLCRADAEDLI